ncbi:DUF6779 domain-containing protein [Amycolatopsis benzoatilytica]|uniref:DUF6779 domain-containing protein n=1 Tax=Amycolatopsis benzoatilytica TaxID=346045 RepID=UPI0003721232|nr:DUF6779 domain-containing protein [Amycolatopsis benzoatilytica]
MTGVGDDSHGRRPGRPWLVVGLLLAVGATVVLVLSDDLRYLRLGIVAALWAALIGAFLAVRARKNAAHSEEAVAEAQAVYELELEREIAARREFELELESEAREAAQAQSREELDALRAEVAALRESLQSLFGGEVLLERVALTAQATRMRALNDEQRLVSAGSETKNGNGKKPAQLLASNKQVVEVAERPTELMDRVFDSAPAEQRRAPANGSGGTGSAGANGSISAGLNGFDASGERQTPARGPHMPRLKPKRPEPESRPVPDTRPPKFADELESGDSGEFVVPERAPRGRANLADAFGSRGGRAAEPGESRSNVADAFASRSEVARESRNGAADSRGGEGFARNGSAGHGPNGAAGRGDERNAPVRGAGDRGPRDAAYAAAGDTGAYDVQEAFDEDDEPIDAEPLTRGRDGSRGPAGNPFGRDAAPSKPRPLPREARADGQTKPVPRRPQNEAPEPVQRGRADSQPTRTVAPVSRPEPVPAAAQEEQPRPAPRLAARPAVSRAESPGSSGSAFEATKISRPVEPAAGRRHAEPVAPEKEVNAEPATRAPSRLEQFSRSDLSPLAAETPTGRHGAPGGDVNPTLPESVRSTANSGAGGRRRRADEAASTGAAPAPAGGGRRRRPEGEPPAWEASAASPSDAGSADEGSAHGRRAVEAEPASGGSHAAGRSVTELLAANGKSEGSPRRRRRAED